jgi:mannosyl-3-phosphoglycerate phosphatase
MEFIIFTDLDGTLLDFKTYSFDSALEALTFIKDNNIPLIITTSKTKAEVSDFMRMLNIHEPFIVENGGGIFLPKIYRGVITEIGVEYDDFRFVTLGLDINKILSFANTSKAEFNIKLYNDFSEEELSIYTGLEKENVLKSQKRNFSVPFIFLDDNEYNIKELKNRASKKGIKILRGGRFYHFVGINQDKGRAVKIVQQFIEELLNIKTVSIGIGDSLNDLDMLKSTDIPVLVKKYDGTYENVNITKALRSTLPGPEGFNEMILKILKAKNNF